MKSESSARLCPAKLIRVALSQRGCRFADEAPVQPALHCHECFPGPRLPECPESIALQAGIANSHARIPDRTAIAFHGKDPTCLRLGSCKKRCCNALTPKPSIHRHAGQVAEVLRGRLRNGLQDFLHQQADFMSQRRLPLMQSACAQTCLSRRCAAESQHGDKPRRFTCSAQVWTAPVLKSQQGCLNEYL